MTIEIKVATTQEEVEAAFFLWMENYQREGYLASSLGVEVIDLMRRGWLDKWADLRRDGMGFMLIAKEESFVVGTLTVEFDFGRLQVSDLFPEAINELKATRKRMAYFGSFAIHRNYQGIPVLGAMFRRLSTFLQGVEIGVCVVNPCHVNTYTRMGFSVRGTKDNMPKLQNAKAVLLVTTAMAVNVIGMRRRSTD